MLLGPLVPPSSVLLPGLALLPRWPLVLRLIGAFGLVGAGRTRAPFVGTGPGRKGKAGVA